jgi:hypothetical protein
MQYHEVLTLGDGGMDECVASTLLGHYILEKGRQISSRVPLEEIVEHDDVVTPILGLRHPGICKVRMATVSGQRR